MKPVLSLVTLALTSLLASPAFAVEPRGIDEAIQRGVTFLKSQQVQNGTWNHPQIGATALAGLTLLECQVPLEDPAVQKTASAVRGACVDLKQTYSLSLVILFLDRLGDPGDESFIQSMTTRLLAGQTASCGWSYNCPLVGQHREEQRLRSLLNQRTLVGGIGPTPSPPSTEPRRTTPPLPPPVRALLQQVAYIRPPRSGKLNPGDSDNSNTQFALIALWVARRHGLRLPVGGALAEAAARFRWSQYGDGSWGYKSTLTTPQSLLQPVPGDSSPAMTCAGLLGLGVARGASRATIRVQARDALTSPAKPRATADVAVPQDPAIRAGLLALARAIGQPAGDPTQIRPAPVYGNGGRLYYFLWSLERVAVVYGLDHIGKKDWYAWGSEILLASQDRSGGWTNGEFSQGCCDTCFALLFLRRANLARSQPCSEGTGAGSGPGGADLRRRRQSGPAREQCRDRGHSAGQGVGFGNGVQAGAGAGEAAGRQGPGLHRGAGPGDRLAGGPGQGEGTRSPGRTSGSNDHGDAGREAIRG